MPLWLAVPVALADSGCERVAVCELDCETLGVPLCDEVELCDVDCVGDPESLGVPLCDDVKT